MSDTIVATYTAQIWVGTRKHYSPQVLALEMAREWLHDYVNRVGLCVTLTPTEYIYTGRKDVSADPNYCSDASEPGFVVGLINYPRFPSEPATIKEHALSIARGLLALFEQFKVTVVFPDHTVMVSAE